MALPLLGWRQNRAGATDRNTVFAANYVLHVLKSSELPGGFEFEVREILGRIEDEAEKKGLLPEDDFARRRHRLIYSVRSACLRKDPERS